ncbi:MAG: phosphate ABC transporter substrate-binding protein [Pseudomonadales bacterium]|nr:phosphate ABC transporter substrate-binding protein [Pseudomonadales bacterium]
MHIHQIKVSYLPLLLVLSYCPFTLSDIAVVVHPDNQINLDEKTVRKIFLSKTKAFPDGEKVEVYDLPAENKTRIEFGVTVLRKSEARLNSYWARMLFSSKARPPVVLENVDEIKAMIASNPHAIAYMDLEDVDDSVKVVLNKP